MVSSEFEKFEKFESQFSTCCWEQKILVEGRKDV
jgi:hypothetical protein